LNIIVIQIKKNMTTLLSIFFWASLILLLVVIGAQYLGIIIVFLLKKYAPVVIDLFMEEKYKDPLTKEMFIPVYGFFKFYI
jgi:type IV secretory pathway TrbL component